MRWRKQNTTDLHVGRVLCARACTEFVPVKHPLNQASVLGRGRARGGPLAGGTAQGVTTTNFHHTELRSSPACAVVVVWGACGHERAHARQEATAAQTGTRSRFCVVEVVFW